MGWPKKPEDWTKANFQQLFAAMKANIPPHVGHLKYTKVLKAMDWNMVAFPPFSPEACKEKWNKILKKMSRTRTLTELLIVAEDVISNSVENVKQATTTKKKRPAKTKPNFEKQKQILQKRYIKTPKLPLIIKRKDEKRLPGEPKRVFRSACAIFRKERILLLATEIRSSRERFRKASEMWLELSPMEKKLYKSKLINCDKAYSKELQKWFKTLSVAEQKLYWNNNHSKIKFLDDEEVDVLPLEPCGSVYRPSDSEDEDTDDSSDDDDDGENKESDEEEEEEDDVIVFDMY